MQDIPDDLIPKTYYSNEVLAVRLLAEVVSEMLLETSDESKITRRLHAIAEILELLEE